MEGKGLSERLLPEGKAILNSTTYRVYQSHSVMTSELDTLL